MGERVCMGRLIIPVVHLVKGGSRICGEMSEGKGVSEEKEGRAGGVARMFGKNVQDALEGGGAESFMNPTSRPHLRPKWRGREAGGARLV